MFVVFVKTLLFLNKAEKVGIKTVVKLDLHLFSAVSGISVKDKQMAFAVARK